MVSPDNPNHSTLEKELSDFLAQQGYLTASGTYHTVMPKNVVEVLQKNYSPTALCLRGRSDRIAIHPQTGVCFEWEAKTHGTSGNSMIYNDMMIEALPLCHYIAKSRLNVRCLYAYRNTNDDHCCNAGFWVDDLPKFNVIFIPTNSRWSEQVIEWFKCIFEEYLPDVYIQEIWRTNGSDDPMVKLSEERVKSLVDWKYLIREAHI